MAVATPTITNARSVRGRHLPIERITNTPVMRAIPGQLTPDGQPDSLLRSGFRHAKRPHGLRQDTPLFTPENPIVRLIVDHGSISKKRPSGRRTSTPGRSS
ncbi:putative glucose-6-phosphate 1-dehydrogenase [Gordonia alkanivorans NBRC 16433]|uniref:Putative glucose-6-phosphate 1-dehydrogenase n=1 Tax=Gordonia alkanivorans NBRC 16433 TaxID=1027371 RepID=F9VU92_9ACTN|nr:putative glucose-6-phosphate 1-dehydrogenase [Gordonia alkanivorans NBRC 16433]